MLETALCESKCSTSRAELKSFWFQNVCAIIYRIIGGGDGTPIGHWRSSSKSGTPTISFGVVLFEQHPLRQEAQLLLGDRATRKHAKDS